MVLRKNSPKYTLLDMLKVNIMHLFISIRVRKFDLATQFHSASNAILFSQAKVWGTSDPRRNKQLMNE